MSPDPAAEAEKKWNDRVLPYLASLYEGTWIPSHDMAHHLRVWKNAYALQLVTETSPWFYEELYLACLFHDVGMVFDTTEKHGHRSRLLCEEFLAVNSDRLNFDPSDLLEAIERHDDKTYSQKLESNQVYHFLSIADDMDAFGALGLYRYIEIYLLRNIPRGKVPGLIMENAALRFRKTVSHTELHIPIEKLNARYEKLRFLLKSDSFTEAPLTLIEWLDRYLISKKKSPWSFFLQYKEGAANERIRTFLTFIREEIVEMENSGILNL